MSGQPRDPADNDKRLQVCQNNPGRLLLCSDEDKEPRVERCTKAGTCFSAQFTFRLPGALQVQATKPSCGAGVSGQGSIFNDAGPGVGRFQGFVREQGIEARYTNAEAGDYHNPIFGTYYRGRDYAGDPVAAICRPPDEVGWSSARGCPDPSEDPTRPGVAATADCNAKPGEPNIRGNCCAPSGDYFCEQCIRYSGPVNRPTSLDLCGTIGRAPQDFLTGTSVVRATFWFDASALPSSREDFEPVRLTSTVHLDAVTTCEDRVQGFEVADCSCCVDCGEGGGRDCRPPECDPETLNSPPIVNNRFRSRSNDGPCDCRGIDNANDYCCTDNQGPYSSDRFCLDWTVLPDYARLQLRVRVRWARPEEIEQALDGNFRDGLITNWACGWPRPAGVEQSDWIVIESVRFRSLGPDDLFQSSGFTPGGSTNAAAITIQHQNLFNIGWQSIPHDAVVCRGRSGVCDDLDFETLSQRFAYKLARTRSSSGFYELQANCGPNANGCCVDFDADPLAYCNGFRTDGIIFGVGSCYDPPDVEILDQFECEFRMHLREPEVN